MAQEQQAAAPTAPTHQPIDWADGLPLELWQRCLGQLSRAEQQRAPFKTSRRLARAVLLSASLQREARAGLRLDVERAGGCFASSAKALQALAGGPCSDDSNGLTLRLYSASGAGNPSRCWSLLLQGATVLTCVTRLELQGLSLDTLIANAIPTLLPNLRQLRIDGCRLTAAAATCVVSTACASLNHIEARTLTGADGRDVSLQLVQLAALPALSSFSLLDTSCPSLFLLAVGNHLTTLHLDRAYRQVQAGTQTPAPSWRAALAHAARCTALQCLAIPCATDEELGLVAPALQQLRRLHLNGDGAVVSGDALVERLLALPHLTSLAWDNPSGHTFQRSHASSPCRWKELRFKFVSPHQLARLPLRSLASPVAWDTLIVAASTSVAEAQAAADNVAACCLGLLQAAVGGPPSRARLLLFKPPPGSATFPWGASFDDTPAALLRALRPLLAACSLAQLSVSGLAWGAELVTALGEALPSTCADLTLVKGSLTLPACAQLAKSLPWLRALELAEMAVQPPHAVLVYATLAAALPDALLPSGRPRLQAFTVRAPARPAEAGLAGHQAEWERVRGDVRALGVHLSVRWA